MNEPTDTQKGNLIAFLNNRKKADDNRPAFQGKLTLPGNPAERGFALWASTSKKTGDTMLTGEAGQSATMQIDKLSKPTKMLDPDAAIQIAQTGGKGLIIDPHGLLLFTNKQKDAENVDRPDYWGYYNPGGGERLMRIAVWARTDRSGNAMLTGNIQRDEPKKELPAPAKSKTKKTDKAMDDGRDGINF